MGFSWEKYCAVSVCSMFHKFKKPIRWDFDVAHMIVHQAEVKNFNIIENSNWNAEAHFFLE